MQSQTSRPGDLYFVSGEYIMRVPVTGGKPRRVVKAGQVSVTGMAIVGDRLFWVTQAGEGGSLRYVSLHGAPVAHTLVGNLSFSMGLVAADGWLYWADENAIGRVRPDGAHLTRRFVAPPQENGGGVANGLGTDGQHLFFSRCQDNEIGRVDTNGRRLALSFIKLPAKTCPQALAVGNNHVYWAELVSYVGQHPLPPGSVLRGRRRLQHLLGLGRRGREPDARRHRASGPRRIPRQHPYRPGSVPAHLSRRELLIRSSQILPDRTLSAPGRCTSFIMRR
jgi:hypothetical protein